MTHDVAQNRFDIACLRSIKTDPHARRQALAAAMIKLHALAIARELPRVRQEALEIVGFAQQLYAERVTRDSIAEIVYGHFARSAPPGHTTTSGRTEELVEALWTLISTGQA